jgi:16S rRNA (cytidine1402-2'-O)-methyltransferase
MSEMLSIIATPIGNLEDISARAVKALREADVIACEDTRRTRILLNHHHIPIPAYLISYREHQEGRAGAQLMALLKEGKKVALCSDGGVPGISDPGYRLVRSAIEEKVALDVIPGASAVLVALIVSGLSTSSFTFRGFPPRKYGALKRFFAEERNVPHTLIIFESPFRVATTLRAAFEALGDRQAAVCIELTKKFERISRGFLRDLSAQFADVRIKGEVTIVIAGSNPKFSRRPSEQGDDPEDGDGDIAEREP